MKTITVKLSSGLEVTLTEEDVKVLKPIIDQTFANLDDSEYERIKKLKSAEIIEELKNMTDGDLLHFAKINDDHIVYTGFTGYGFDNFTMKIRQELFKRNGFGYKQIRHLSRTQRNFLKSLGLKDK